MNARNQMQKGQERPFLYDVFICHASEDKDSVVRPLAEFLRRNHIEVWYDEFTLQIGDSIRRAVDRGLSRSRFGIVVFSRAFFSKEWPQYELDGLLEKEIVGREKVILPIWHEVDREYVARYSLSIAGRLAANTSTGISEVADQISKVVKPNGSPLILARDHLIDRGVNPPVITDKHWLNVIEASNNMLPFGAIPDESSMWGRWSFPLPPKDEDPNEWGNRLAWTYMQMAWVKEAEEIPITPLTPHKEVHSFIARNPGLLEICREFPKLLIEWAPQLTIPGFEGPLYETVESLYQQSSREGLERRKQNSSFGTANTLDGRTPLCDEELALRHPQFGMFDAVYVAEEYFHGGIFGPTTSPYEDADHLFWLLSKKSQWLPGKIRRFLLDGVANWSRWLWGTLGSEKGGEWPTCGLLAEKIRTMTRSSSGFKLTKKLEDDLDNRIIRSVEFLGLPESPNKLKQAFLSFDVINKTIAAEQEIRDKRRGRKKKRT
jgi:hypothetical protein